jgi:hypothetical protein
MAFGLGNGKKRLTTTAAWSETVGGTPFGALGLKTTWL